MADKDGVFHEQGNVIVSISGPLYPPLAEARGLNSATYGLVLSIFRGVLVVFIILIGILVERFGLKRTFVWSIFLNGLSPLLFAFISYVESASVFLALSFILRGLEGIGAAGIIVAVYMCPSIHFPGSVSPIFGVIQTVFVMSNAVGPLIGTLLDTSFGFTSRYALFGILQLVGGLMVAVFLPPEAGEEQVVSGTKKLLKGYWDLLKILSVLLSVYACAVSGAVPDSINAVLQPNLVQYDVGEVRTGWMFFLMAVPQFVSPVWGFIIDRMKRPQLTVLAGCVSTVIGCMVLGPFPGIDPSFPLLIVGLLVFGFSQGLLAVACVCNFRLEVIRHGVEESMLNISFVSIVYGSSTSVGAAVGPLVTGLLYNAYGFPVASLFAAAISIILFCLVLRQIIYNSPEPPLDSTHLETTEEEEREPLLDVQ